MPSACVPPVTTSHARRGFAPLASTTSSLVSAVPSPRTARRAGVAGQDGALRGGRRDGRVGAEGERRGERLAHALPRRRPCRGGRRGRRRPPRRPSIACGRSGRGCCRRGRRGSRARRTPGRRSRGRRRGGPSGRRALRRSRPAGAEDAPWALVAVVSGSAAAVAAARANAASPAVLRMVGSLPRGQPRPRVGRGTTGPTRPSAPGYAHSSANAGGRRQEGRRSWWQVSDLVRRPPGRLVRQPTETALQAAATVFCCTEPAP